MKVVLALVMAFGYFSALGQTGEKCLVKELSGGKFNVADQYASVIENQRVLFIVTKLSPNKFTDEYLRKVAKRIRATYCNEAVISTVIIDSSDKRKFDDLTPPPIYPPATRALYYINRVRGEEKLQLYKNEKVTREILLSD